LRIAHGAAPSGETGQKSHAFINSALPSRWPGAKKSQPLSGQPAWLHVWVSEQAICYVIDERRSADVLEEVIGLD